MERQRFRLGVKGDPLPAASGTSLAWVAIQPGLASMPFDPTKTNATRAMRAIDLVRLPRDVAPTEINHLLVWSDRVDPGEALPPYLAELSALKSLSIPSQACPHIRRGMLPSSLIRLNADTHWDRAGCRTHRVQFSGDADLRGIREVGDSGYCYRCPTRFMFEKRTFPDLNFVSLTLDRDQKMLQVLGSYSRLLGIRLAGFRDLAATYRGLEPLGLRSLALAGTHAQQSAEGIEILGSLRHLKLIGFSRLTDLSPLRGLTRLESVSLYWLKRLADLIPLLHLPNLRRINSFGCGEREAWKAFLTAAKERGINVDDVF